MRQTNLCLSFILIFTWYCFGRDVHHAVGFTLDFVKRIHGSIEIILVPRYPKEQIDSLYVTLSVNWENASNKGNRLRE